MPKGKKSIKSTEIYFGEPMTIKWWSWLIANNLTKLKNENFKDYGYALEEICDTIKNFKVKQPQKVREALMSYFYGNVERWKIANIDLCDDVNAMFDFENVDSSIKFFGNAVVIKKLHELLKEYMYFTSEKRTKYVVLDEYHKIAEKYRLWCPI